MLKKGLAVAVILLFIGICVVPSTAIPEFKDVSTVSFDGNTLYVGGNGTGNYTTIQDAIDDAVDGDTVFVFDDSSPYYENVVVNKSINIMGENRNSTIVDGGSSWWCFTIESNYVNLSNFNIIGDFGGIKFYSHHNSICFNNFQNKVAIEEYGNDLGYNVISNNKIHTDIIGIFLSNDGNNIISKNMITSYQTNSIDIQGNNNLITENHIENKLEQVADFGDIYLRGSSNIISNNTFKCITENTIINAIELGYDSNNNKIIGNNISGYDLNGIIIQDSSESNLVSKNFIINCCYGISIVRSSCYNVISDNTISNSELFGILISSKSHFNKIDNNNFLNNKKDAKFNIFSFLNTWDGNYWGEPQESPYIIIGTLFLFIPWYNFDWNPAQTPMIFR